MSRINLITNPSFQTNTTGWSGTGSATVARSTSDSVFGSSCLQVTKAAASNSGVSLTSRVAVTQNLSYAISAYVKIPLSSEDGSLQIKVEWFTAVSGGSSISSTTSALVDVISGADWTRIAKIATAPATAAGVMISIIQPTAGTVNKTFLVDAVLFEQSSAVNLYIDEPTQAYETTTVNRSLTELPRPWITGMKLQADIQLGGLILNTIDENGVVWVATDISGWWGHPDPEMPDIDRGWGDGSYDVRGRWQARQLTLEGVFLTPDPALMPAARNTLIEASNLVYTNAWLYVNESPTKASKVRLSGRPSIETVNARGRTEFSIGLRAADPIKYEWNWEQVDGYTTVTIPAKNVATSETGTRTITNNGNTNVTVILEITGPLAGSGEIYNAATDQLITTVQVLRPATTKTVSNKALTSNIATLTTSTVHGFLSGDAVTVSISDAVFDGTHTILTVPTTSTFTYSKVNANVASAAATGNASIAVDVLEIDTYDKEVAFNGSTESTRSMIDTLVDWIVLAPGDNEITFEDTGAANGTASMVVYYRSGWIG
jgi:hypothetical protein